MGGLLGSDSKPPLLSSRGSEEPLAHVLRPRAYGRRAAQGSEGKRLFGYAVEKFYHEATHRASERRRLLSSEKNREFRSNRGNRKNRNNRENRARRENRKKGSQPSEPSIPSLGMVESNPGMPSSNFRPGSGEQNGESQLAPAHSLFKNEAVRISRAAPHAAARPCYGRLPAALGSRRFSEG